MSASPNFASMPKLGAALVSTANTGRDGTGTLATILTAAATGTRVRAVHIRAQGTTTAGMLRLYLHDGTTAHLVREIPVAAITPSATVEAFSSHATEAITPDLLPFTLPSGWSLRASTHNAESFRVVAEGADL